MSHPSLLAQESPRPRWATQLALALVLGCVLGPAPSAWALIKGEAVTLDYQVRHSDVILRGTCVATTTGWSNRNIVTTYKVSVKKYLKAPAKMSLVTHPVLYVSQVGGRVSSPLPLEETHPEMAALFQGEEVVLFLQSPESVPAALRAKYDDYVRQGKAKPSPLMDNFRLTTLNISKMSVVSDPQSGAQMVTRASFDRYGVAPSPELAQRYAEALQNKSGFIEVVRDGQKVKLPVPTRLVAAELATTGTMEQQIAQMANYANTWEGFQQQVNRILNSPPVPPAPVVPLGAAQSPQAIRMVQPR